MTETLRRRTTRTDIFSPGIFRPLQPRMEPRLSVGRVGKRVQSLGSKSFCTAALTMFLLFAAVLFGVTPAEASIPRGDVAGEASASLHLHEYPLATSALTHCRFIFAEGVSILDAEHAPRALSLIPSEMSRCERTYARNNPLKYVDPDGLDFINFGKQTVEVYTGEVLFIEQKDGGEHTFTYSHQGTDGEIFGYENSSFRNLEPVAPGIDLRRQYKEWTGDTHPLVELTAGKIGNVTNPNSSVNGARVLGVIPLKGDGQVSVGELSRGAGSTKMYWNSPRPQCATFSLALAKKTGYSLQGVGFLSGSNVKAFRLVALQNANRVTERKTEENAK